MTICIAAACQEGDEFRLVLCTDRLASSGLGTSDSMLKTRVLPHNARCLTAGTEADILAMIPILRNHLRPVKSMGEKDVAAAIREALAERKKEKADEYIRGQFGFSYDELINFGKKKLPLEDYREALNSVRDIKIDSGMIIAGFEHQKYPLLLETDGDGRVITHEDFAVIGSGKYLASAALLQREHVNVHPLARAIYTVYEAKKFAERVSSVGKRTSMTILKAGTTDNKSYMYFYGPDDFAELEKKFEEYGPKRLPTNFRLTLNKTSD